MPLDWKSEDKVIVPPPKTLAEIEAIIAVETCEMIDFYLTEKSI